MKRLVLWGGVVVLLAIACAASIGFWLWVDMQGALDRGIVLHERTDMFEIERGATLGSIAQRLQELGWLKHAQYFRLEARRLKLAASVKAGLYEVHDGDTPRDLLHKFVAGDVKSFQITFIEGSTFAQMRAVLAGNPHLDQTLHDSDDASVLAAIGSSLTHPEGRFFPSTYRFSSGDSDLDILRRSHMRMQDLLAFHWQSRAPDLPYASPDDALIMASIIEKETGKSDERAQIAGVFARRLHKGMKLQTDPTVIYGLGDKFDGNLRRVDLRTDTVYNTYTRKGLPPTPIAMPGEASIEAALHPDAGEALFFVGKGDGSHQFSNTLREHNAAVRRYQLGKRGANK